MLTSLVLAALAALLFVRLVRRLERLRRARANRRATRVGATLLPTWQPSERPLAALDATETGLVTDWSRYERPACQRRGARIAVPPTSRKEKLSC
jgi:hypothetical protein